MEDLWVDFIHSKISVLSKGKQVNIDNNADSDPTSDGKFDTGWTVV